MFFDFLAAQESIRASAGLVIFLAALGLKLFLARVLPVCAPSRTR